jgi:biofilm PGA synthesis N-glycosyltransferase PgaC
MLIAQRGYRIVYEPDAYAVELSSESIKEELKRKIRIAAGGIQSIVWLKKLLNPFLYPLLSFQYISHRVLRWTVTPFLMILAFVVNVFICITSPDWLYITLLAGQVAFYGMGIIGWYLDKRNVKSKIFYVAFYFCMMNYAVLAGIRRYLKGSQSAVWVKAKRRQSE